MERQKLFREIEHEDLVRILGIRNPSKFHRILKGSKDSIILEYIDSKRPPVRGYEGGTPVNASGVGFLTKIDRNKESSLVLTFGLWGINDGIWEALMLYYDKKRNLIDYEKYIGTWIFGLENTGKTGYLIDNSNFDQYKKRISSALYTRHGAVYAEMLLRSGGLNKNFNNLSYEAFENIFCYLPKKYQIRFKWTPSEKFFRELQNLSKKDKK